MLSGIPYAGLLVHCFNELAYQTVGINFESRHEIIVPKNQVMENFFNLYMNCIIAWTN